MKKVLLSLDNLAVRKEGRLILDLPLLEVFQGESLVIIGPNGAGKTTLLMAIAGLVSYTSGKVLYAGAEVEPFKDLAFRRRIALVMQSPLLFHMTVRENIAAGLKFRGIPGAEINRRVTLWLEKLSISHLANRPAHKLSGGEAQRVSLARAFVLQPDLLLLDEPFSALDAPSRMQLIHDLKQLLVSTQTTAIFITHDLDEALALGDRLAVLIQGVIRQVGSGRAIFSAPADSEIARFTGVETIIPGTVVEQSEGLALIQCQGMRLQAITSAPSGKTVFLCIRPEDVTLSSSSIAKTSARNTLPGTITQLLPQGPLSRVGLDCGVQLVALVTRASVMDMGLEVGHTVQASFKASAVHVIEQETTS